MAGPAKSALKAGQKTLKKPRIQGCHEEFSTDIIWGIHPILELLRSRPGHISEITIQESRSKARLHEIMELAKKYNIKVRFSRQLKIPGSAAKVNHQGVLARVAPCPAVSLEKLLEIVGKSAGPPILLALDNIMDPHNLGAIIRSAAAVGVSGIILPKDRSAPLTATAAKISAGALSLVTICRVTNLTSAVKSLQKEGFWIFGADGSADRSIYETDFSEPACLVIGSEGKGIRPLVKKQCDFLISIPMQGALDSLNASVAAGIILFEIVRSRAASKLTTTDHGP
ncbi:MAG: 23S rRNA (guanosine(2251)-2'-O)-methyltransferase RlmB [Desulfobulbaceae bacterium]|nr:23S rRNA (guanosine(2251)-2'-O)-methyltransferase RlmB [Desulfobulbaceae bacterium]MCK5436456.1 23S rRNA (guanosine(2251)-2'-O)-methyltransferase RlmB [Desulfobulbaceae bacterium]